MEKPALINIILVCILGLFMSLMVHAHSGIHERLETASKYIVERPEDPQAYVRRAHLFAEHGDWQLAFADLDRAAEFSSDPHAIAFDRALLLRQWAQLGGEAGLQQQALQQINHFLTIHPKHADALLLRARLYRGIGQTQAALADYTRSIAVTEKPQASLFIEQAEMLEGLGRAQESIAVLEQSIGRLGVAPLTVVLKAIRLETRRGKANSALLWFERQPPLIKNLPNQLILKGDLLREAGKPAQARSVYCEAWKRLAGFPSWRRQQPAFTGLDAGLSERLDQPCH
jgi:tetratricopeptide (TPR) repeat protein